MPRLPLLLSVLTLGLMACQPGTGALSSNGGASSALRVIVVERPLEHWGLAGFVEMAPTVRVSIPTGGGAETRVFLRIPDDARVTIRSPQKPVLMFPPGTESDRVSFVLGRGGHPSWIEDVRGTRWDAEGREWFHVYLPRDERLGSPLVGVEWARDDAEQERRATEWLVDWGRSHGVPPDGSTMGYAEVDRFRELNHCQSCHVADKAEATSSDDPMPPWPTDGRGLYAPQAVLSPHALLSSTPTFDDPNFADPFVKPRCASGTPRLHGSAGNHWFSCDRGVPHGDRDLDAAMRSSDAYAARTCRAREYLVAHMDEAASAVYRSTLAPCSGTATGHRDR